MGLSTDNRTLQGRVAIVVGASRGIGAATARFLAASGAKVVVAARGEAALEAVAAGIREDGGEALAVRTDALDARQLASLVEMTVAPHTASEEAVLSAEHLPEMITAQELDAATQGVARANRSRAVALASFFASSLDPAEQKALLGDTPWLFRKVILGVVGARRMQRFHPFVRTPSIAL